MPDGTELAKSASSSTIVADLPPSSRKARLSVGAPFSMMRLPTAVDPVNEIRSTLGERVSSSPTRWSDEVTTFRTPRGKSVSSATSRPSRVAFHGVSGAGLSTTVLPVASACPSLFSVTSTGKFHGTIAPTTPTGSFQTWRVLAVPLRSTATGRSVRHGNSSISLAGYPSAPSRGMSSWLACVVMRGHPTSRMSSSRRSSRSFSSATCSWARHSLRRSRLVDQSVTSNARRAASMARCISALDASATRPRTSSVAGLTLSNVSPDSAPMSSPSTSIRSSWPSGAAIAHPFCPMSLAERKPCYRKLREA